jgi:hypothetical protein
MCVVRFPSLCARCLASHPARTWKITRGESCGNLRLVWSVHVPVCGSCHTSLWSNWFLTWGIGLAVWALIGVVVGLLSENFLVGFGAGFPGLVAVLGIANLLAPPLGTIHEGGEKVTFCNPRYQTSFESANGRGEAA